MSRFEYTVLLWFEFSKNFTYPLGKLRTKDTSPIAKSSSPTLSDTTCTFFACCLLGILSEHLLHTCISYESKQNCFYSRILKPTSCSASLTIYMYLNPPGCYIQCKQLFPLEAIQCGFFDCFYGFQGKLLNCIINDLPRLILARVG